MHTTRSLWFENALLLVILALLGFFYAGLPGGSAQAAGGGWDTNGVMAVTTSPAERLVLIDSKKMNICVYKILGAGQFRLVSARSYKYDVEVQDSKNTDIEKGNGVTYHELKRIYDAKKTP